MLAQTGFEIHKSVFSSHEVEALKAECERVAEDAHTTCVRRLRDRSPTISQLAKNSRLSDLMPANYAPVRSILFDKTPESNWPVTWHQDLTISVLEKADIDDFGPWSEKDGAVHVQPPTELLKQMITLRIHLDDATSANGALRVILGSHRHGRLNSNQIREWTQQAKTCCECSPGDILAMSPLILHASHRSATPSHRRVIHFEYAKRTALHAPLRWCES